MRAPIDVVLGVETTILDVSSAQKALCAAHTASTVSLGSQKTRERERERERARKSDRELSS